MKIEYKDALATGVVAGCFITAWTEGVGLTQIPEFILGALYATGFVLVIQYYFRKKESTPTQ